ncbi:hypothetical protein PENSPDRAFT_750631 [Peniophora sp. CONT]|nr:hypothetical protein PENSPDRAFT_750631 [Peniophora sp. CONT]
MTATRSPSRPSSSRPTTAYGGSLPLSSLCGSESFWFWMHNQNAKMDEVRRFPLEDFPRYAHPKFSLPAARPLPDEVPQSAFNRSQCYKDDLDVLRDATEYNEDDSNPLYLSEIWLNLSRAYRIHVQSRQLNEFTMRRGIDFLLNLVEERRFGEEPPLKLLFETDMFLPFTAEGPNATTKVKSLFYLAIDVIDFDMSLLYSEEFWIFTTAPLHAFIPFAVPSIFIEYNSSLIDQGDNQVTIDLVAACRFAGFLGLTDMMFYGCYIGEYGYYLSSAKVVPSGETIVITRYDRIQPLFTFYDFVKLYVLLCEISDRVCGQFAGKNIDGQSFKMRQPWKTSGCLDAGQHDQDLDSSNWNGARGDAGTSDGNDEDGFSGEDGEQSEGGAGTCNMRKKRKLGNDECDIGPRASPSTYALNGKEPLLRHPTPVRESPIPSFLACMDSGVALKFGDPLASQGDPDNIGKENEFMELS